MATSSQLQLRRGTAAQVASFTGAAGEVTPDMTNNRLVLHDGTTAGGHPQASKAYVDDAIAGVGSGLAIEANNFASLQSAVDHAHSLGGGDVILRGTYTLSSALLMWPKVRLIGTGGATITQGSATNLVELIDFSTNAADGGAVINCIVDGNRANNTDSASSFLIYIGAANDVVISDNTLQNGNGYGVDVSTGARPVIVRNSIVNVYAAEVAVITSVPQTSTKALITDNIFRTPCGQHPILLVNTDDNIVSRNKVFASLVGASAAPLTVNTSGTTVSWASGPDFSSVSPGMFLVMNTGAEYLITAKASNTSLTVNSTPGTTTGAAAAIGEGDLISVDSSSTNLISENRISGGVTGGIVISNATGGESAQRNVVLGNVIDGCGECGISTQSVSNGTAVGYGSYVGNHVTNCSQIGAAGPGGAYNTAINFVGADIHDCFVDGNFVWDFQGTPTTQYWMGISGVGNGEIRVGDNASKGTTNPGILGGVTGVTLSAGWGTGASVASIVSHGKSCRLTITAGTSPAAQPSFTVNAPAVPSDDAPLWQCKFVSGTGSLLPFFGEQNSSNGNIVAVYNGTPVNGGTYTVFCNS